MAFRVAKRQGNWRKESTKLLVERVHPREERCAERKARSPLVQYFLRGQQTMSTRPKFRGRGVGVAIFDGRVGGITHPPTLNEEGGVVLGGQRGLSGSC